MSRKIFYPLGLAACLLFASLGALIPSVFAQTDQSFWVGAIPKTQLQGTAPVTVVAASGAAQTVAFPAYGNSVYDITLTANVTFTFTAPPTLPTGNMQRMFLYVRNTAGAWTMAWPASVKWSNGTVPTFVTTAGTAYLVTITTVDGGVTYVANLT